MRSRYILRYRNRQTPQVVELDHEQKQVAPDVKPTELKANSPVNLEFKVPQTQTIKEPTNAEEALAFLDGLSSSNEAIPECLFALLQADDLTSDDIKNILIASQVTPPTTTEEKNRLEVRAKNLFCPFSLALMRDPVIAADNHTYENASFRQAVVNPNRDLATVGFGFGPITHFNIKKNDEIRTDIISVLKSVAKKLSKEQKKKEEHVLTPPSSQFKNIMWPKNPGAFAHYSSPFGRLALSQLRNPDFGIKLIDVVPISGRLVLETKEGTLSAQENLTKTLKEIFPGQSNDAVTFRIPSELTDRMFGVKFNWETSAIEGGPGHQQENWRAIGEELKQEVREITPVMTKVYAAKIVLQLLKNVLHPQLVLGTSSQSLEPFLTLEQQNAIDIDPEIVNAIVSVLTSNNYSVPEARSDLKDLVTLLNSVKTMMVLVESQTAWDKENKPLVRIQLHQPLFNKAIEVLGEKYPDLKNVIQHLQAPRYRTAIRESFVNDATAFAMGSTRAKAELEFKGVENDEAFFTVKGQLPRLLVDEAPKRFVFKCDASGSMNLHDQEQLELIRELFIEKESNDEKGNPRYSYDDNGNRVRLTADPSVINKRMNLSDADLNELQAFIEKKQEREKERFPEKYNDIVAALKTPNRVPTRMFYAQKAFKAAYEKLRYVPNARLTLMTFSQSDGGRVIPGFGDVAISDAKIIDGINSFVVGEGRSPTYFVPGVKTMLKQRRSGEDLIEISVTDGQASETEEPDAQTPEQVKQAIISEFNKAGFTPTVIIVGYKFNEIVIKNAQGSTLQAATDKARDWAKQVVQDYAAIGAPGSESHTITQSHRLQEVFATKGNEFVKSSSYIVTLPLDSKGASQVSELVAYPNTYFEKVIRIPLNGRKEIDLPNFGKQIIDKEVKATQQVVSDAYIAEMEKRLVAKEIDPRMFSSFATLGAKQIISELRSEALKKAQEAKDNMVLRTAHEEVVRYLDKVQQGVFTPTQTEKLSTVGSISNDRTNAENILCRVREAKAQQAQAGQVGLNPAISEDQANKSRYRIKHRPIQQVVSASLSYEQSEAQMTFIKKLHEEAKVKENLENLTDALLKKVLMKQEMRAPLTLSHSNISSPILSSDVKDAPSRLEVKGEKTAVSQSTPKLKPITNQGAVFAFDWDDTIIKGHSHNLLIGVHGWPQDHKVSSPEEKETLIKGLWDTVKNMEAVGGSWQNWGIVFKTLLRNKNIPAIVSLNAYGRMIIPVFMKEKMGLTPEEISQIPIYSYQIESKLEDSEFGKEHHLFQLLEERRIPLNLPKYLIDDNEDNNRLFTKNAQATAGRELDEAITATADGAHIAKVLQIATTFAASLEQVPAQNATTTPVQTVINTSENTVVLNTSVAVSASSSAAPQIQPIPEAKIVLSSPAATSQAQPVETITPASRLSVATPAGQSVVVNHQVQSIEVIPTVLPSAVIFHQDESEETLSPVLQSPASIPNVQPTNAHPRALQSPLVITQGQSAGAFPPVLQSPMVVPQDQSRETVHHSTSNVLGSVAISGEQKQSSNENSQRPSSISNIPNTTLQIQYSNELIKNVKIYISCKEKELNKITHGDEKQKCQTKISCSKKLLKYLQDKTPVQNNSFTSEELKVASGSAIISIPLFMRGTALFKRFTFKQLFEQAVQESKKGIESQKTRDTSRSNETEVNLESLNKLDLVILQSKEKNQATTQPSADRKDYDSIGSSVSTAIPSSIHLLNSTSPAVNQSRSASFFPTPVRSSQTNNNSTAPGTASSGGPTATSSVPSYTLRQQPRQPNP